MNRFYNQKFEFGRESCTCCFPLPPHSFSKIAQTSLKWMTVVGYSNCYRNFWVLKDHFKSNFCITIKNASFQLITRPTPLQLKDRFIYITVLFQDHKLLSLENMKCPVKSLLHQSGTRGQGNGHCRYENLSTFY